MPYEKELAFLTNVFRMCNLSVFIFNPRETLEKSLGSKVREFFDPKVAAMTFEEAVGVVEERTFYSLIDSFFCQSIFMKLHDGRVLLIGPYIIEEISDEQILERAEQMGMSAGQAERLEEYYRNVPVIGENSRIFAVIDAFCNVLWEDGEYSFVSINLWEDSGFSSLSLAADASGERDPAAEMEEMEKRYMFENQLMEAVSRGQAYKAEMFLTAFSHVTFEQRLSDTLRNSKNYMIIMNTLLRKAAEKGGVHPLYLDKMSSKYAKEIEGIKSVAVLPYFMKKMFEDYCKMVNKHNTKNLSPLIKNVVIYIDADLSADISLKDLAEMNGVSASYLSTCFKKETGKAFVDYLNGKRMDMAKHLLKTTNLQIQTVAQHCGFVDMHYFSKVFKKYTQKTPREYRELKKSI